MIGFDNGKELERRIDGKEVTEIGPQLSSRPDFHLAKSLRANEGISFMGITPAGPFDLPFSEISNWLTAPNPNGLPNSDVLRFYLNGQDINQRARWQWTIDFGVDASEQTAAKYELPFEFLQKTVRPIRAENRREAYAHKWWIYAESRPAMRAAFRGKTRFLATCMVAKHRIFAWLDSVCLPANVVIVFGRADDFFFGILNSHFHLIWSDVQGTQLREKESGSRYTPTTCFENFPFPCPTPGQDAAIAAAAKELNELRENWLNPPEWTATRTLEFPGSVTGPWARFIDPSTINHQQSTGLVRYPITEPRDAGCAAKLAKRTLTNLYNERPAWLANAHAKLDAAVATAYGWPADLSDDEILTRLLALNLERAAEEARDADPAKKSRGSREKSAEEML
jgi:hypothetical protein